MRAKRECFFLLAVLMACLAGCRRETAPGKIAQLTIDEKDRDREIQEALGIVTNWQSHFDLFYVKRSRFEIKLSHMIADETDNERYRKHMGQFIDAAFGISTDAEDSGARLRQLDSFCTMTDAVLGCAEFRRDWDMYWTIALRRLKRIQDEMKRLKIRFPDNESQGNEDPVLGRGGWDNCLKLTKREYGMAVEDLVTLVNNILMTHVLSYEKWSDIRARLEEIVGHEVKIKDSILKLWEKRRAVEASSGRGAENESRERHVPREGEKANRPRDAADGRCD